jgi:hypothetical protein
MSFCSFSFAASIMRTCTATRANSRQHDISVTIFMLQTLVRQSRAACKRLRHDLAQNYHLP